MLLRGSQHIGYHHRGGRDQVWGKRRGHVWAVGGGV